MGLCGSGSRQIRVRGGTPVPRLNQGSGRFLPARVETTRRPHGQRLGRDSASDPCAEARGGRAAPCVRSKWRVRVVAGTRSRVGPQGRPRLEENATGLRRLPPPGEGRVVVGGGVARRVKPTAWCVEAGGSRKCSSQGPQPTAFGHEEVKPGLCRPRSRVDLLLNQPGPNLSVGKPYEATTCI